MKNDKLCLSPKCPQLRQKHNFSESNSLQGQAGVSNLLLELFDSKWGKKNHMNCFELKD